MPFTFFAHQAPVLPIARRWPSPVDGVALVIGSMAPDMAYVLNGSRLRIWAHGFPGLVTFCVPVTLAVSWIVVRVLAPVVPDHLPPHAPWFLRDYRGLATHRFRLVASPVCAFLGALSHVALDEFTHDWGWFARNVSWYHTVFRDPLLGVHWTVFRIVQYIGHVGGTAICVWLLARYGRERWMMARAAQVSPARATTTSMAGLVIATALGFALGAVWVLSQRAGSATDVLRVSGTTFAGLTAGAIAVRAATRVSPAALRRPARSRR